MIKKVEELDICIVETQKSRDKIYKKQLQGSLEEKSTGYKRPLWILKVNLPTSLRHLKNRFTRYADVTNKLIITNINNKLSEVTEKINSEQV